VQALGKTEELRRRGLARLSLAVEGYESLSKVSAASCPWPFQPKTAGEIPSDGAEALPELLFVARADNEVVLEGVLHEPTAAA
jgi:hypothetical protein